MSIAPPGTPMPATPLGPTPAGSLPLPAPVAPVPVAPAAAAQPALAGPAAAGPYGFAPAGGYGSPGGQPGPGMPMGATVTLDPATAAQLQALPPAQQAQALNQIAAQQLSMPGQQATLGAEIGKPPSKVKTILKNVLGFGAAGAAIGFGASFISLPFVGQVAAPIAAAVGAGIGALFGLVRGIRSANKQQAAHQAAVAEQAAAAAPAPVGPDPVAQPARGEEPAPGRARSGGRRYTVRSGDTLSKIAARHDIAWQQLYRANREAVGPNPHLIHPGLKLRIPAKQ